MGIDARLADSCHSHDSKRASSFNWTMSFYSELRDAIGASVCDFLSDAAQWKRTFDKIGPIPTPNADLPNAPAIAYGLFCNRPPEPPAAPGPGFTGGQCECAAYRINYVWDRWTGPGTSDPTGSGFAIVYGPISSIQTLGAGTDINGNPGFEFFSAFCRGPGQLACGAPGQKVDIINSASLAIKSATVTSVEPWGGSPNNCGDPSNPPIPSPAPNSNIYSPTITFIDDSDNSVTVNPTIAIGVAFLNASAEINIPVDVTLGDIVLQANLNLTTGDLNLGPSFNFNSPETSGRPAKPCECIPPTGSDDDPPPRPPGVPEPPAPPDDPVQGERRIVGAVVTVTDDAGADTIDNSLYSAPNVATPYYGLCFFVHKSDNGILSWSEDFKVKVRQQYVACPWPDGAVSVTVAPRYPQQSLVATPIYREDSQVRETEPIS